MSDLSKKRTVVNFSIGLAIAIISLLLAIIWQRKSGPQKVEVVNPYPGSKDTIVSVVKFDSVSIPSSNTSPAKTDNLVVKETIKNKETKPTIHDTITIAKKESLKEDNTKTSDVKKEPECKEKNTGDFCFENATNLTLSITVTGNPTTVQTSSNTGYSYSTPFTCTIKPGQKKCFYNINAGPAKYDINNNQTTGSPGSGSTKSFSDVGSVFITACKTENFIIKD